MVKLNIGLLILLFVLGMGCKNTQKTDPATLKYNDSELWIEKGKEIASITFLSLSAKLQDAMKSGGFDHALSYCNVNALEITDSIALQYDVDIKRTSLKFRNPKNKPSKLEEKTLLEYQEALNKGQMLTPKLISSEDNKVFHAPILVQDMCLKCHGSKDQIENFELIKRLYPNDLAHDYLQGEVRGMWSITFSEK